MTRSDSASPAASEALGLSLTGQGLGFTWTPYSLPFWDIYEETIIRIPEN